MATIRREGDGDIGTADQAEFVPVKVADQAPIDDSANSPVAVVEVGRARIRIAAGTDPRWVAALVAELDACWYPSGPDVSCTILRPDVSGSLKLRPEPQPRLQG